MIVDSGLQHIADQMSEQSQTTISHMAVGTGINAEAPSQTALQTESARVALTSKIRSDKKVMYIGDFAAGVGTGALTEVGLLNAASTGVLLSRVVFPVKNKGPSDTLKVIIEHTYARG